MTESAWGPVHQAMTALLTRHPGDVPAVVDQLTKLQAFLERVPPLLGGNPLGGSGGGLGDLVGQTVGTQAPGATLEHCQTGADANEHEDCRILAVVNSVQEYWTGAFRGYEPARTRFFEGGITTGCGAASSAVGPCY